MSNNKEGSKKVVHVKEEPDIQNSAEEGKDNDKQDATKETVEKAENEKTGETVEKAENEKTGKEIKHNDLDNITNEKKIINDKISNDFPKKEENKKERETEKTTEVEDENDAVYVERIINVKISEEVKKFIKTFIQHREDIMNWCTKNNEIFANKINEKTSNMFFNNTTHLNEILQEESMNIDLLSVIVYFYNLYCTHNDRKKVNLNDLLANSHITYRGIYEKIDTNSRVFKNLLKEEKKYKLQTKEQDNTVNDLFSNYKKTYPYAINLIIGMFLTFISGYYGALLIGYTEFTSRLICGIIFSYVGLILEVFIFIIIYEKSENIKKKKLKIIKTYSGLYKKMDSGGAQRHDLETTEEIKKEDTQKQIRRRKMETN